MFGSASLCSKNPLWSYQASFAGPPGRRARSSLSLMGSASLPPRCETSVDVRLGQLVLKKSLVVVPSFLCRTAGQAREIFFVLDGLGVFAAALRDFRKQRAIQALHRLAAFVSQLSADAAFIFHARDF